MGLLWFSNVRGHQLRSLVLLGLTVAFWLLFNALSMVVQPEYLPLIYTLCISCVCFFAPACLWFCLYFTGSRLASSGVLRGFILGLAALDLLALVTNPWHHLFYRSYGYPLGEFGPLFYAHGGFTYICITLTLILLFRQAFGKKKANQPQQPLLPLAVVMMVMPFTLNALLNFNILKVNHDLTPIGLFVAFLLFAFSSYTSQMFTFRTTALSNIFDSIQDSIVITDRDNHIIDCNNAFYHSFPDFVFSPKTPIHAFLSYLEGHGIPIKNLTAGNEISDSGEFTLSLGNNTKTYTFIRTAVHNNKRLSGYVVTLTDVSAYRAMIEEINHQNKQLTQLKEVAESASAAKGAFLANMSHEMRTPMNAIIGMTNIAKSTDDVERKDYCIQQIGEASVHLLGVINDVLDISKIESGKFELYNDDFDFGKMLAQIAGVMSFSMQKKDLQFDVDIDDGIPPYLYSDEQRLSQVITNLLSNAVKFTPEGGRVGLSVRIQEEANGQCHLKFEVSDNGIGISHEQQQRLFRSFEQADGTISRRYGGTGLGLAISKSIVDMMGGSFQLISTPGVGSRFIFTITASIGQALPESDTGGDALPDEFLGCRVLLAEDIAINREIVLALLEPTGLVIDCVENGKQAVDMFENHPSYDMILMDIQMPEMDGYLATRTLRALALPQAKTVPIIAMTANVFKEDIERCLAAGMNGHVGKPLNLDEVLAQLRRYLRREPPAVEKPDDDTV